jgi:hypothetical protein
MPKAKTTLNHGFKTLPILAKRLHMRSVRLLYDNRVSQQRQQLSPNRWPLLICGCVYRAVALPVSSSLPD